MFRPGKLLFAVFLLAAALLSASSFSVAQQLPGEEPGVPPGVGEPAPPPSGDDMGGDSGPGPVVVCVPAASCASLGCGRFDSCGAFCGACPVPSVPAPVSAPPAPAPVPVPVPAPAPVSVQAAVQSAAKPLQALGLKFPLPQLFMRSVSFTDSDCVRPGESALLAVKVRNTGKSTLKGVSFTASLPEAGIYSKSGSVSIKPSARLTRFLGLDIPDDAAEGDYYLRLTVSNSKSSRTVYRAFTIGSGC